MKKYKINQEIIFKDDEEETDYLNKEEEDKMEVKGYRVRRWSLYISWFFILLSLGTLRLIFYWFPRLYLYFTHKRCSLDKATTVLVKETVENHTAFYIRNILQESTMNERGNNYCYYNEACVADEQFKAESISRSSTVQSVDVMIGYGAGLRYSNIDMSEFKWFLMSNYRWFLLKNVKYIWVKEKRCFLKLTGLGTGMDKKSFHKYDPLSSDLRKHLRKLYGLNEIIIDVQSYLTLFLIEVLSPYYFFQIFSIIIWILDDYMLYTYAILIVSSLGIIISIVQTHKAQVRLRKTIESSAAKNAEILNEDGTSIEISSRDLVPGDKLIIPDGKCTLPCDAVILSGTCIVQESMLTGESAPLTKTPLPCIDEEFLEAQNSIHMLYSGTKVIQSRKDGVSRVTALVIRTGYSTARGDLVKAILYPPPVDYAFEQSVYTFINLSAIGAVSLAIGVSIWMAQLKVNPLEVFIKAFELVTMVIPAAIPGSLTLSKIYAVRRLYKKNIFCLNPKVINVAGSTNCICFDKTGTITEDGLDVKGIVSVENGQFTELNNPCSFENERFKLAMASCHSLSLSEDDELIGDPLDIKMFVSTNWIYEKGLSDSEEESGSRSGPSVYPDINLKHKLYIRLLHQNQFVSDLQRMSVVTQEGDTGPFYIYCKGSPETIAPLSIIQTVPSCLKEVLQDYTSQGYRVLALGYKKIDNISLENVKLMSRNILEADLEFLGLLILENKVKTASIPAIEQLKRGNFKITMATGDNIQTAISVSRECKIIENNEELVEINEEGGKLTCSVSKFDDGKCDIQRADVIDLENVEKGQILKPYKIAISGNAWEIIKRHYEEYVPNILVRTAIIARATARQKQQVITYLQAMGYSIVMCGDGANDCAALKAANVGVSLSQGEACVASALSSTREDISCIPTVVQEGRASLVACLGLMKFTLSYGYIQLISVLISYGFISNLSDFEFIYQDIFLTILFSLFFSLTEAYEGEISHNIPSTKIMCKITLISLGAHTLVFAIFQFLSLFWIQSFLWYKNGPLNNQLHPTNDFAENYTYKNYAVFSMSIYQIIIACVIFSKGCPYRKPLYTNYIFFVVLIVMTIMTGVLTTYPGSWIQQLFVLALPPMEFRYSILSMAAINFIISYIVETFLIELLLRKLIKKLSLFKSQKKKYEIALEETNDMSWLYQTNIIDSYSFIKSKRKHGSS